MRKQSEVEALGFPSLRTYLLSDRLEFDPPFNADLLCTGDGVLTIKLSKAKSAFRSFYLLLTGTPALPDGALPEDAAVPLRRILLSGEKGDRQVSFDLHTAGAELFGTQSGWACYIAMEDGESFLVGRLRQKGDAAALIREPEPAPQPEARPAKSAAKEKKSGMLERLTGRLFGRRKEPEPSAAPEQEPASAPTPPVSAFPPFQLWEDRKRLFDTGLKGCIEGREQRLLLRANATNRRLTLITVPQAEADLRLSGGVLKRAKSADAVKRYPYTFSIVMAVYKVEDYLEEAIDSILQQDIGFEEHVQLILVDDGSPDGSGAICDRYAEQYPDNIVVIHKKNGGVASARNAGKAVATGKYVNFMDPDDKLSLNTLSAVQEFFDAHSHQIDVVAIPLHFFEAKTGPYWQNYKFNLGTRVSNLWQEWIVSDMNAAASFIRLKAAQKYEFDSVLPSGEDSKFLMYILLEKMQIGVVAEGIYWYRRRNAGGSLINTSQCKRSWYFEYFDHLVFDILNYSKEKYGFVPDYIQNTIMMDLQWRFHSKAFPEGVLTHEEQKEYLTLLTRALNQIDDQIILKQRKLSIDHLIQLFRMKYQKDPELLYSSDDIHLLVNHHHLRSCSSMVTFYDFISLENNTLNVEGSTVLVGIPDSAEVKLYLYVAGDYHPCEPVERSFETENCFGVLKQQFGFRVSIPVKPQYYGKAIRLVTVVDGHPVIKRNYLYRKFTPFFGRLENQYYCKDGYIVHGYKGCIKLEPATEERREYENQFLASLEQRVLTEEQMEQRPVLLTDLTPEKYEQIVRLRSFAINYRKKRPIWLVSDRIHIADDNGEAMFRYLMSLKNCPADVYFVISSDNPNYERLAAIGPVLDFGTEDHLKMHLVADVLIASQSEDYVVSPFGGEDRLYNDRKYYCDLLVAQKYVFLQHGITKDDVSKFLYRHHKNIVGFITSTGREYQSILDYDYYYAPSEVWFTGLPRFDRLYEDSKGLVAICPTWRSYLKGLTPAQFEATPFFKSYKELLTDERLRTKLAKKGCKLCLKLHPELLVYEDSFRGLDVTILEPDDPYRKMYAESSIVLTDFSSAVMDFAYMRKPVVYFQFDREEFFANHYTPGYFDYFEDGFGPVTKTVDETVDAIIDLLERDCKIAPEYLQRINDFFPVNDFKNCQRVYEKILELDNN